MNQMQMMDMSGVNSTDNTNQQAMDYNSMYMNMYNSMLQQNAMNNIGNTGNVNQQSNQ